MPLYWAKFKKNNGHTFRYDTRIYLTDIENISDHDICIGAIVGKNPGSAKATYISNTSIQPISLDGDKLLPTVRNIFLKALNETQLNVQKNA